METGNWDSFPSELSWVDFRGDWGNQQKMVVNDNDDDNDEKETTITMTKIMIRRRLTPSKNGKLTFLSYYPTQGCELEPLFGEIAKTYLSSSSSSS